MAWAEDRATWRHDLSVVPGTKTERGAAGSRPPHQLRDWYQCAKSFQPIDSLPLANGETQKFHFTLNHYTPERIGLTPDAGGLASRPNHALTCMVTFFALAAGDGKTSERVIQAARGGQTQKVHPSLRFIAF
jgi:hypothetical protein